MDIAIDFDGTCVTHEFPRVGRDIGAAPVLKKLVANGHRLILFTMRSNIANPYSENPDIHPTGGNYLDAALEWFKSNDIPLYGIQTNPGQATWTHSPKAYAHLYIDDAALGCPLIIEGNERPFVDWQAVERLLTNKGFIRTAKGKADEST